MNTSKDLNNEQAEKENPLYPVDECCSHIEMVISDSIIRLYHSIDNFIFQDIDYSRVISNMPQWVADGGISPELNCTKEWYEALRRKITHPIFGRFIYHYDLWSKIAAMQDRLSAVMMFMRQLYTIVPCKAIYEECQYTSAARCGGTRETRLIYY